MTEQDRIDAEMVKLKLRGIELKPGKKYQLKMTKQFCHLSLRGGDLILGSDGDLHITKQSWTFVGTFPAPAGIRNIFYSEDGAGIYCMFSVYNLDHIVKEIK